MCRSCDERDILNNSFELLFAFDEIISEGYRENVNLSQVKNNIDMESHEEKIQEIIARVSIERNLKKDRHTKHTIILIGDRTRNVKQRKNLNDGRNNSISNGKKLRNVVKDSCRVTLAATPWAADTLLLWNLLLKA
jgi:hypothetical protein